MEMRVERRGGERLEGDVREDKLAREVAGLQIRGHSRNRRGGGRMGRRKRQKGGRRRTAKLLEEKGDENGWRP